MTLDGDPGAAEDATKAARRRRNPFDLDETIPVKDRMQLRPNWLFILALTVCAGFWVLAVVIVLRVFK